jgi:hypothetical protein
VVDGPLQTETDNSVVDHIQGAGVLTVAQQDLLRISEECAGSACTVFTRDQAVPASTGAPVLNDTSQHLEGERVTQTTVSRVHVLDAADDSTSPQQAAAALEARVAAVRHATPTTPPTTVPTPAIIDLPRSSAPRAAAVVSLAVKVLAGRKTIEGDTLANLLCELGATDPLVRRDALRALRDAGHITQTGCNAFGQQIYQVCDKRDGAEASVAPSSTRTMVDVLREVALVDGRIPGTTLGDALKGHGLPPRGSAVK